MSDDLEIIERALEECSKLLLKEHLEHDPTTGEAVEKSAQPAWIKLSEAIPALSSLRARVLPVLPEGWTIYRLGQVSSKQKPRMRNTWSCTLVKNHSHEKSDERIFVEGNLTATEAINNALAKIKRPSGEVQS